MCPGSHIRYVERGPAGHDGARLTRVITWSPVPSAPSDLTVRPLSGPDELDLFCRLTYLLDDELADDLAAGRRRADWLWVALRDDRLVARLGWWGRAGDPTPLVMDVFDL